MTIQGKIFKDIWDTFTSLEIGERDIETRTLTRKSRNPQTGQWEESPYDLHYYKWSSAWREAMNHFPSATYEFETFDRGGKLYDVMYYANETASVHCTVTIEGVSRDMWLPVMDYSNKAIPNPSARDISDAKMRCLVKTLAMFGLGMDLYEGKYSEGAGDETQNTETAN